MDVHAKLTHPLQSSSQDFTALLLSYRKSVDAYLSSVINERINVAAEIDQRYGKLWLNIQNNVLSGGKRIRPFLVAVGYGGMDEVIMPVAAAQEFIHIAMLMHDDVIDQDTIRHGTKNINGLYNDEYANYLDESLSIHFSNSAGMLAGDLLISEAYNQLNKTVLDKEIVLALHAQLTKAIFEVVGGELLDVEATILKNVAFDPMKIYKYKTASYSFLCPLISGATCANLEASEIEALKLFAENLGVAYQIQDDMIGVFGDEAKSGKSVLSDLREGKQTLLINIHEQLMDSDQASRFKLFGKPEATTSELEALKNDIEASGAKQQTLAILKDYFDKANLALNDVAEGFRKSNLEGLIKVLQSREA